MSEWKTYRLGDIIQLKSGGTPDKSNPDYWGGSIPWISAKSMYDDFISTSDLFITEEGLQAGSKIAKKDSILLLTRGSGLFNRIPVCYVVSDVAYNQDVKNIVLKQENVTSIKFLYYWLYGNKELLSSMLETTGIGAGKIDTKRFLNLSISLPSQKEQARYIHLMDLLFDKIELNRRIDANLEAQAQALFRSWFVDFEPFRDGPFVDSELGKIPQGWEICCVEDLASYMVSGGTPKSLDSSYYNGDIRWFTTKELKDGFLFDSEKHISETALKNSAAKLLPENTVLMAIYASPTVGRLGILTAESTYNQAAVGIIAKKEIGYAFLYLLLLSERTNLNNLASGAAQQNLNVGIVKRYRVLVPTIDILNSFNEIVNPIFTTIKNNTAQIHNLSALRDTLLPKLMAGEIKIN